jgi:hypothetical protein
MSYDAMKARARAKRTMYDFDPDATTATDIAWVDMKDFATFLVGFFRTVGTSDLTFKILANTASDGSGTDITVLTKTLTGVQPNALADYTWAEVTAEQVQAAAKAAGIDNARYVTANLTFATGTDEGVVYYELGEPRFAYADLTADDIA